MVAPYVLITGGAGFIGTNLAHRLLSSGKRVRLLDNLARPGVERNVSWLKHTHGDRLEVQIADVVDPGEVREAVRNAEAIFHFAAQVAVTTSLVDPMADFEVNLRGTLNILEALRALPDAPPLLFTSTNKVYGALGEMELEEDERRYRPAGIQTVNERQHLDFHSPYGCSKGAADQYVLDYARIFGLRTVVFRMSCIYGPHQFGTEDQGWVAHFVISTLENRPITIYGDGKQVRDILFVEDLVDAMLLARKHIDRISGHAFNMGGGPTHTVSLLEIIEAIEKLHGRAVPVQFEAWRPGDQKYYVSDTSRFIEATGWRPRHTVEEGVGALYDWLLQSRTPRRETILLSESTTA